MEMFVDYYDNLEEDQQRACVCMWAGCLYACALLHDDVHDVR